MWYMPLILAPRRQKQANIYEFEGCPLLAKKTVPRCSLWMSVLGGDSTETAFTSK